MPRNTHTGCYFTFGLFLKKKLANAAVSRVVIERPAKNARVTVFSARPGVVIGKKGIAMAFGQTLRRRP